MFSLENVPLDAHLDVDLCMSVAVVTGYLSLMLCAPSVSGNGKASSLGGLQSLFSGLLNSAGQI